MSRLSLPMLLLACTEYSITPPKEDNPPADTDPPCNDCEDSDDPIIDTGFPPDTDIPEDQVCEEQSFAGSEVALNDACYVEPSVGTFTPVVEYRKNTWSVDPSSTNIMMMPAVASLTDDNGDGLINQDDVPDIIVITYGGNGTLRAVSGDGTAEIFNVSGLPLQGQGAVAVGDIDLDGIVEIVAPTSNGLMAFEHDGTVKWTSVDIRSHIYGTSDAPAISDMDGDGVPEVICGRAILRNDGTLRGAGAYGKGSTINVGTTSFAVDLDLDGFQEVVTGNALYDAEGNALWYNGQPDGYVAVANFDSDPEGEIIVMQQGEVRLQDTDGTVLWRTAAPGGGSYYGGPPTVADFDGDGEPEVGVASRSAYSVIDTNGTLLWSKPTQDSSSGNTGSAVFDFEGDGVAEAVYADETRLWVFNGPDGAVKLESTEHSNATWTEYSVIADVDADGQAEIVVPNTSGHMGFYVFGDADNSWQEGRRIWNQHAYHITNVNDDGTIPAAPEINWATYNNFRSGDLTAGTGGVYPDLLVDIVDVCTFDCDMDLVRVWVQVGNRGYAEVTDSVELVLEGETTDGDWIELARESVTGPFPSGMLNDSIAITIDLAPLDNPILSNLRARVDGGNESTDSVIEECDETNNEDEWGENLCLE
jgi:hypothetical protein